MKIRAAAVWSILGVAMFGAAACTAESGDIEAITPAPSGTVKHDAAVPKPDATASDAAPDVAKPDAPNDAKPDGTTDAKIDAAPDAAKDSAADVYAAVGSPCTNEGTVESRGCGVCGKQQRLCLSATWQDWGSCSGEVVNGCMPGSAEYVACGMCGQQKRECTSACSWITGICGNEPVNACEPGLIEYSDGLSCATGSGRTRECAKQSIGADGGVTGCTWSNYSASCVAPLTSLVAATTAGQKVGGVFIASTPVDYQIGRAHV